MDTGSGARQKDFQNVFQNSDIKERKNLLAKVLHFPEFNEEDDLRPAILVEVYYDMLAYLVNNGLPWREVSSLWEIFQNLLNEAQGKPLVEAITLFKEQLNRSAQYSCENNLKCMIDYVFLTLFQHYKLYQFVLTQKRADDVTEVQLLIEPPVAAPAMRDGVPKSAWDEEQRIKQIDDLEQKRNQERTAYHENEIQHAVQELEQEFLEFDTSQANLTAEDLATILANVAAKKAAVTSATISHKMEEMHDSLEFKYKRANVGHENDKGGKKSAASSRRSKGNSGKK